MTTSALLVFLFAQITVIGFTLYFFIKVLRHKPTSEYHGGKQFDAT